MTITNPSIPDEAERELRAKYLDWCSAQVADQFLALSPDEIFELAERAAREDEAVPGRSIASVPGDPMEDLSSYRSLVELVTEVLAQQMSLPLYEEWLELYRSSPESVESQLLGFWREHMK
ncbi:MAG TPA: hypothetical protein VK928_07545 [Longimicrobiales bacterium]|nr:hypothetical protein [Longimicrobiales bacterium]